MDDIRAVMDAEGSERAALIGHYDSGAHSAMFAATTPFVVSSTGTVASRSGPRVTGSWRRSTARRAPSSAPLQCAPTSRRSASMYAPGCTRAKSNAVAVMSAASRYTSALVSRRSPDRAKFWRRTRSRTSSSGRASASRPAAATRSRACPTNGCCSRCGTRRRASPPCAAPHRRRTRLRGRRLRAPQWPGPTPRYAGSRGRRTRSTTT
jgi:pimeloyl-ACP methyl ester carboxylesterase